MATVFEGDVVMQSYLRPDLLERQGKSASAPGGATFTGTTNISEMTTTGSKLAQ